MWEIPFMKYLGFQENEYISGFFLKNEIDFLQITSFCGFYLRED